MEPIRIRIPEKGLVISGNTSLKSHEAGWYEKTTDAKESVTSDCFEILQNGQLLIAGRMGLGVQPTGLYKRIA